jgi:hypothetical protein
MKRAGMDIPEPLATHLKVFARKAKNALGHPILTDVYNAMMGGH